MNEETREELIQFCIKAVKIIEGVDVKDDEFHKLEDDELQKEADWFDYLLGK